MANTFYQNAFAVLQSLGQVKPGDNVRIQEFTAIDTYCIGANAALSSQQFFSNSQTKNFPYRNITFPDTSRSYIFQYARVQHDFQFTVSATGSDNLYLNSFNRWSTFQWVINGVQSPHFWMADLMPTQFGNQFSTTYVNTLQQAFQTWYELKDPINLAAGVNAQFNFVPQSGLTTIAAFNAAATPYAPNNGVGITANCTLALELNGFQWSIIS